MAARGLPSYVVQILPRIRKIQILDAIGCAL